MLSAGEITISAVVHGYDEKTFKTKDGREFHIAEIYIVRERKKDEDKKKYGNKAESFTYFFGEDETAETCDIKELLKDIREGKRDIVTITGRWNNYKLQPSNIEIESFIEGNQYE